MTEEIIGHGTWFDKMAMEIIEREQKLGRSLDLVRTEMGLGASGLPHIGNFGDAARSFAVTLALRNKEVESELIAFTDDRDGLRKIPAGFPDSLTKYLGYPVTDIPDPYKCHSSFGEHMTSLLLDALDKCKVDYKFVSANKVYKEGLFNDEIKTILENAVQVGQIVKDEVGQDRYTKALPYFPICSNCGRIYTTTAHEFVEKESKVAYSCDGMEIKGKWLKGCGHQGEVDYRKGEGKLSWKSEFAVRWKALDIRFEAYGKDIEDSVRINDRICREILLYEPPVHARYEMFLDKSGKKISSSAGNVFTPQVWFRYGSPQSLNLLMLKRFAGTRGLSVTDVPNYMSEFDELEDIYFRKQEVSNKRELAKLTGLYKYCWWLNLPSTPDIHVSYNMLAYLVKVAPKGKKLEFVTEKLRDYGFKVDDSITSSLAKRVEYAVNWNRDFAEIQETAYELKGNEKMAVEELLKRLKIDIDAEEIQSAIFEAARKSNVKPREFFKILYIVLLGSPRGPRLGPYIATMGIRNVTQALKRALKAENNGQ